MSAVSALLPSSIPSPEQGTWNLGPVPLRAYALAIIAGIVIAIWLGNKRYVARGGQPGLITDIALWAVPFGIIGGRLYHVLSDWQIYFGPDGRGFVAALRVWDGGLGIWGAVALGGLGAWIAARRHHVALPPIADAIAPGIALAQAVGRWGNWFNQELFGRPTDLPWALEIDPAKRPTGYEEFATFHPTFLYESLWLVGVAVVVIWADRRFQMGHGRVFALYVLLYVIGRGWIEAMRIDPVNTVGGLRLNVWTSIIVGIGALAYLVWSARTKPGRETIEQAPVEDSTAEGSQEDDDQVRR
ncbi:MAG TPA: prolipoprotein diacylglyceryl transferase [Candidatus Nanopelagicales bacterium]|nr:prolipoprotein diacylglyceryl transferase [Candidatus Nanopelagicales bacterium]